jgi:hypothetical protein
VAGMTTIFIADVPWWVKVGMIAVPAVVYFFMLVPLKFPAQERVAAGVSYRQMLAEFGTLGALVVGFLLVLQLMDFFSGVPSLSTEITRNGQKVVVLSTAAKAIFITIGVVIVAAFAGYTKSLGRPFLFFMILIMMPLATTEIGTDGWITGIMEGVTKGKLHPGWILVYTSIIMMILRFFAGPIVHTLSPLGLLTASATLAIIGLFLLSSAVGIAFIFAAATLYALGKTFFWPTMLGVVSEQTPRGGAMTLNGISGLGMLAVGVLGFPYIGALQADKKIETIAATDAAKQVPALVQNGTLNEKVLEEKRIYEIIPYKTVDDAKLAAMTATLPSAKADEIKAAADRSSQKALANMTIFPMIMLGGYIILLAYFRSKGGYRAQVLTGHTAQDDKFTGGVPGPMEA